MVDNFVTIDSMLKKADASPFYFGAREVSIFWQVAAIEDELFAKRTEHYTDSDTQEEYYACLCDNGDDMKNIYRSILIDFVIYYRKFWLYEDSECSVFDDVASPNDTGLMEILSVFGKSYGEFIKDVLFWFSTTFEVDESERECLYVSRRTSSNGADIRLVEKVLSRVSDYEEPLQIEAGDYVFLWRFAEARNKIWFERTVQQYRGEIRFDNVEYGCVSPDDTDAVESLRDSVSSCFFIDGWKIIDNGVDPNKMLEVLDLNLDKIAI